MLVFTVCNSKLAAILIISIILEHLTFICNFHRKLLARIFLFNFRFQCIPITYTPGFTMPSLYNVHDKMGDLHFFVADENLLSYILYF